MRVVMRILCRGLVAGGWVALGLAGMQPAQAHKPSDSYLTLTARDAGRMDVVWHIALRDLDGELGLDANDDGRLTWGEVRKRWDDMLRFVRPHLRLSHDGAVCTVGEDAAASPALIEHTDGQYAVFAWSQQCPLSPGASWTGATLDYRLFALSDPTHRGIVRWRVQMGRDDRPRELGVVVLGAGHPGHAQAWPASPVGLAETPLPRTSSGLAARPPVPVSALVSDPSPWPQVQRTVRDGIEHIAAGTDHILFLVSLLLVAVWRRQDVPVWRRVAGDWLPREHWRSALGEVLRLVTAFTVAHSITLGLATFGVVSPPSRWVESLIALSVLVAAADNLWPILKAPRWVVVFGFGLVHGFGFAGAMQDLGLSAQDLVWPLLGFNLGVELGQLMLVALVLPLGFVLRRTAFYRAGVVLPGSAAIAAMALVWLAERSTDRIILGWGG